MTDIAIIKNKDGNYLPKHDHDLPIFMHIFGGSIEVKERYYNEHCFLFGLHGWDVIIEDEGND